jgi:peptidoglycan-associated lipoprotein
MRFSRLLITLLVAVFAAGCTCKPHKMMDSADGNIGSATEGGPLTDINFAFDSYALTDTAKGILKNNTDWLKANSAAKVQIEGHCDERGTNEYNMVLGANRARAAFNYYKTIGVDASRMSTISYGEQLPLDPGHNEAAWAKNRRDHFKIER